MRASGPATTSGNAPTVKSAMRTLDIIEHTEESKQEAVRIA